MAKTLAEGFAAFLRSIAPLNSEHEKAAKHKDSVRRCLENNFECYSLFETGSFGAGTGIRHYSDTDYFAVIPTKNLKGNSSTTLREVKERLQETFSSTEGIQVRCPSIQIPFGQYASENLEVAPCDFVGLTEVGTQKYSTYDIPDCAGAWMRSSPSAHNAYVRKEDERLDGKLKPLIQLVKAWKFYNSVPIRSFYLEMRTVKYAEGESTIIYDLDLKGVLSKLNSIELASIQDPMGISGYIYPCASEAKKEEALSKVATGLKRIENSVYYRDSDLDKAFSWLDIFFAYQFPSR